MDTKLLISPISPVVFLDSIPDFYYYSHNPVECYAQKFIPGDRTVLQFLADSKVTLTLLNAENNSVIRSIDTDLINTVKGSELGVYKADLVFSEADTGVVFLRVSTASGEVLHSILLDVSGTHALNTVFIEYKNGKDHENFRFVNLEGQVGVRVEGTVQDFIPSALDHIYIDANRSASTLSSTPYRLFTLYAGNAEGLPDYMLDLVNRAFTCEEIQIDGKRFNKDEGAEWEVQRVPEYARAGMSISIQAIDPYLSLDLSGDSDPLDPEELGQGVLFRRSLNRLNRSSPFSISGIFKDKTVLDYIVVYKKSAPGYLLKVGTSEGGSELGEIQIGGSVETIQFRYAFDSATTIYLSGVDTGPQDFHFVYEKLNKTGGQSEEEAPGDPIGLFGVIMYGGTSSQLEQDFDLNTGLGRPGTTWSGFAVCDGRNGTFDMRETFPFGWDFLTGEPGDKEGQNSITLSEGQLPEIKPKWKFSQGQENDVSKGRDGTFYSALDGNNKHTRSIDRYPIEPFGKGEPIDIRPRRVLSIFVKKIQ